MFTVNLDTTSKISTTVGTALISYAGIRMLTTKSTSSNDTNNSNDCVCDDGQLCPVIDACSRSNLQLGLSGLFIGNVLTLVNYFY